ncbi:unnamed protein product [Rangifer tarandus platyrhynchus]|uniref:Uncharacterized protein n=2 Tax=Rangifer tarandus platyrhynchus TaxID=3082113 RepID=A0ABN8ZEU6_RANTA|nr:unnamed protein product [Rangifer tarandus platyrhynchus]
MFCLRPSDYFHFAEKSLMAASLCCLCPFSAQASRDEPRRAGGAPEVGALGQWAQPLPGLRPHPSAEAPAGCQNTHPPPATHPRHSDAGDGQQKGRKPRLYLSKI